MRPHGIVVPTPSFDDDLRLASTAEPLQAQALVAEATVEALVGTVLPRLARIDQRGLDAGDLQPLEDRLADELGPLSERRKRGVPRSLIRRVSTLITRPDRMPPATSLASASRVNSSITVRHFKLWPLAQVSNTK